MCVWSFILGSLAGSLISSTLIMHLGWFTPRKQD